MKKMIDRKKLLALLAVVLVWSCVLMIVALAADLNTGVTGLSGSYDGGTWEYTNGTIVGSVKTTSSSGCSGTTYTAGKGKLTLTNNSGSDAVLSFDITTDLNSGSVQVDGADAGSSYSKSLANGDKIDVSISSNPNGDGTTKVTLSNIKLSVAQNITVTFNIATNGSYTVDGTAITANTSITKSSTEGFAVTATAASNYKFFGWKNVTTGAYISTTASTTLLLDSNATVVPEFVSSSTPVWDVSGVLFADLNDALSYAESNNKPTIKLLQNGTLTSGTYTIKSGKTLLIPMDDAGTSYKDEPAITYNAYTKPSAFRTLTMANGANIVVNSGGAISLPSNLSSKGQLGAYNGTPTGPDGRINMQSGSKITVKSGGNLYCWGYIYGSGAVEAQYGSTIYEAFQVKDWRGGSATSNVVNYAFIFNQYYVQNIEVPLTVYAGATEKLYAAVNASSKAYPMGATFIGNGGMFNLSSGYLVKDYIEGTDRLQVDIYGAASVTPMTLTGLPMIGSISTNNFILHITSNITINVHSDTTTVTQNIELLPSVEVNIDAGAELEIGSGKEIYVYDNDDWGNFTGSARLYVIGYSVANGTTAKRTAAGLGDAKINVNGTLTATGELYTSAGGANITSSEGTGRIVLASAAPTNNATIYECANNSTKTGVTFTPAQLHNGPNHPTDGDNAVGDYTATAGSSAGTTFYYCATCDAWYSSQHDHTANQTSINGATVSVSGTYTYNGSAQTPDASHVAVTLDGTTLTEGTDYTFLASNNTNAGTATVTVTGIGNYKDTATGTFTIAPKPVTITGLGAQNKTYDGNTTATVTGTATVSGKVGSDTVTVMVGSASFDNKNVGTDKAVTFTGYSLSGADAGNYILSSQPASVTASITAKSVTVSGITAENKTYDGNTDATLVTSGATITGVISGDTVTVSGGTGTFDNANVGIGKTVTISNLTLGGDSAGNYAVEADGTQTTTTASITIENVPVVINYCKSDVNADTPALALNASYTYKGTIEMPVYQYYTLTGISFNGETVAEDKLAEALDTYLEGNSDAASLTVTAHYTRQTYTLDLKLQVGNGALEETGAPTYTKMVGKTVKVTAPNPYNEHNFSYWEIKRGETVVGTYTTVKATFLPTIPGAYVAIAHYDVDPPSDPSPVSLRISNKFTEYYGSNKRAAVTMVVSMPDEGYTIKSLGFKSLVNLPTNPDPCAFAKVEYSNADLQTLINSKNGSFTKRFTIDNNNPQYHVVGYVVYEGPDGEVTLYCTDTHQVQEANVQSNDYIVLN